MANEETMRIIQIDTSDSFKNFSDIISLEHVDRARELISGAPLSPRAR